MNSCFVTLLTGIAAVGLFYGQVFRDTLILRVQSAPTDPYRFVFYRLRDGWHLDTALVTGWHLAFEIPGFTAAIRANHAAGLTVWRTSQPATSAGWSALTVGDTLTRLYDSDTSWSVGGFNTTANPQDSFDLGWGNYNFTTHAITGDSLYIVRLPDGSYKKLWLERLQSGVYYLRHANPDGSNEVSAQVAKSVAPRRSFVYYNFLSNALLNLEPVDSLWDLVFTPYLTFLPPSGTPYVVVGALQNRGLATSRQVLSSNANPDTLDYASASYSAAANAIGYNWKRYDMAANQWLVADSVYYLVRTRDGAVWRLRFVGFGDSVSSGVIVRYTILERKLLGTLASLPGEPVRVPIFAYPNPAKEGLWVSVGASGLAVFRLYNAVGQVVWQGEGRADGLFYISRGSWPAGLYLLEARTASGMGTARLLFE